MQQIKIPSSSVHRCIKKPLTFIIERYAVDFAGKSNETSVCREYHFDRRDALIPVRKGPVVRHGNTKTRIQLPDEGHRVTVWGKCGGGGGFRLEVSKSGQLNVRDSTANNSFPAFKSDTLHPDLFSLFLSLCKYQWTMWLVTTFIKEIVSPILLHSSFFFWPKEVSSIETFNGHYLNITNASVIG